MSVPVRFENLGLIDYQECWDYQEQLFQETVQRKIRNRKFPDEALDTESHLLFCQHPHVYTLGKSGDPKNLLLSQEELAERGIQYYKINRGGDITYHGPGQLVGYPILDLELFFTDIHRYLRTLEEAVILTLAEYGIEGDRYPGYTGVWIEPEKPEARKICAMGVRTSRWVTMHGFAFNINTDLDYFGHIVPCGIDDKDVTSMKRELGVEIDLPEVSDKLRVHLARLFDFELYEKKPGMASEIS